MSATYPADVFDTAPATSEKFGGKKVTIYRKAEGFFGNVTAIKARLHEAGTMKYAQYPAAPFVIYTPFRKRNKFRHIATGYSPFLLIVEGWDAPEPADAFTAYQFAGDGVLVSSSRHLSFSPEWVNEFNAVIDPLIESGEITIVQDHRKEES